MNWRYYRDTSNYNELQKRRKNNEYHLHRQENRKASESKKKHQKKSEERINHTDCSNLLLYVSLHNLTDGEVRIKNEKRKLFCHSWMDAK